MPSSVPLTVLLLTRRTDSSDRKYTALQRACLAGAKRKGTALTHAHQTVRVLLDSGALLNARAPRPKAAGATALHLAASIGEPTIVNSPHICENDTFGVPVEVYEADEHARL